MPEWLISLEDIERNKVKKSDVVCSWFLRDPVLEEWKKGPERRKMRKKQYAGEITYKYPCGLEV